MFDAKYTDVVEALRFDIRNGRFGGRNARLPSFRELSKEYKVSLVTIAKSMNFLQQENVIDIQGTRGAFVKADVTARPRSNDIALIHNFIGDIEGFHAIEALEEYAKEKKMGLLSLKAAESTQYLPELLTKLNADGFIFMHSSLTGETAEARELCIRLCGNDLLEGDETFPEQNDRLLIAFRRAQAKWSRINRWLWMLNTPGKEDKALQEYSAPLSEERFLTFGHLDDFMDRSGFSFLCLNGVGVGAIQAAERASLKKDY